MNTKQQLLNETISILKDAMSKHSSNEDSTYQSLERAVINLEKLRHEDCNSDKTKMVLSILGKFLENIPEIKEFIQVLTEL